MAELTKLLGFMSSWDRQAVLDEYAAKFDNCDDFDALTESLGSPTRVAIALARDYVPTPPPKPAEPADTPLPEETAAPAETSETPSAEPEAPLPEPADEPAAPAPAAAAPVKRPKPSGGAVALCVILGLIIALPVTVALLLIGIPFLVCGVCVIVAAVSAVLQALPALGLFSDILLVAGGGLAAAALGLLAAAFGLWLSLSLAGLWLEKVVFPVGRRICRKKEVPAE